MTIEIGDTVECRMCGSAKTVGNDGYATCYGNPDDGFHVQNDITRPCGVCGIPIETAEMCQDCADKTGGDAFTTNWGSGSR